MKTATYCWAKFLEKRLQTVKVTRLFIFFCLSQTQTHMTTFDLAALAIFYYRVMWKLLLQNNYNLYLLICKFFQKNRLIIWKIRGTYFARCHWPFWMISIFRFMQRSQHLHSHYANLAFQKLPEICSLLGNGVFEALQINGKNPR